MFFILVQNFISHTRIKFGVSPIYVPSTPLFLTCKSKEEMYLFKLRSGPGWFDGLLYIVIVVSSTVLFIEDQFWAKQSAVTDYASYFLFELNFLLFGSYLLELDAHALVVKESYRLINALKTAASKKFEPLILLTSQVYLILIGAKAMYYTVIWALSYSGSTRKIDHLLSI